MELYIDEMIIELQKLRNAKRLLEKLYHEVGPYRNGKIREETWYEIRNYFKFDDSE